MPVGGRLPAGRRPLGGPGGIAYGDGMHLAHERTGSGRPLVLIHGITESRRTWDPLIPALAERYDVLCVDLRGHGESPHGDVYDPISLATDVAETVDAVGMVSPLVVGHSLGGIVASAYAAVARPRAVVNVDQPLRLADFKAGLEQLEPMLRGDDASFRTAIDLVFQSMMGPLGADEVERVGALRRADQSVVLGIWGTVFESTPEELDATVAALAGAITVPCLSLHGIDPGEQYTHWLRKLVPSATVEVWPEQGHYPHLIHRDRFVERVWSPWRSRHLSRRLRARAIAASTCSFDALAIAAQVRTAAVAGTYSSIVFNAVLYQNHVLESAQPGEGDEATPSEAVCTMTIYYRE
jgi:pimeloyl-ACP methyl ester carboxylesterase